MVARRFWTALIRGAPILAVIVSILFAFWWLRWTLSNSAERFRDEFIQQNLAELAAGDTLTLTRKLEALSTTVPWTCIKGQRIDNVFFAKTRGACGNGILTRQVRMSIPENPDIAVTITFTTPFELIGIAILLISGQVVLLLLLNRASRHLERETMNAVLERERAEAAVTRAIASMTQMLAHDVRRPFTTLKIAIMMLERSRNDIEKVNSLIDSLKASLQPAVAKVEGLIADVMEIGSNRPLQREECSVQSLWDEAVIEVFAEGVPNRISLVRGEGEQEVLLVERRKIHRALSNILQNAKDALKERDGRIELRAKKSETTKMLTLTVRNTNSMIPKESISRVFDSFYTAKEGGTGLGLAIAKKVTEDHGGEISCESSEIEGVSFHLTFPLG